MMKYHYNLNYLAPLFRRTHVLYCPKRSAGFLPPAGSTVENKLNLVTKLPQRPPFLKDLFIRKFDYEILSYPKIFTKDRYDAFHKFLTTIEEFFANEVDSVDIDSAGRIPNKVLDSMKKLGLFGMDIPIEYGGLGLSATEYSRLNEIVSADPSIAFTLAAHQLGLKGILLYGSDALKKKYLKKLADGEMIAAFGLTEKYTSELSIQCAAYQTENGTWLLNGTKTYVFNGDNADIITVFALNQTDGNELPEKDVINAFIVERGFEGVSSGPTLHKIGLRGVGVSEVYFKNTPIPSENILGKVGEGFDVGKHTLNSSRLLGASFYVGALKSLISSTTQYLSTTKIYGQRLTVFESMREKLKEMSATTYALESMTYLTGGWADLHENQDTVIESAILRVFASERVVGHCLDCLEIHSKSSYLKSSPYERMVRDVLTTKTFEEPVETLKSFIILASLRHVSKDLAETTTKLRNPVMHPAFVLWHNFRTGIWKRKLKLHLFEHVHLSLRDECEILEKCISDFGHAFVAIVGEHGKTIASPSHRVLVVELANALVDIYAMTAVISRASRSYCDGIYNSDHEMDLAKIVVSEGEKRITSGLSSINVISLRRNYVNCVANATIFKNGYAAEPAITKFVW